MSKVPSAFLFAYMSLNAPKFAKYAWVAHPPDKYEV